MKPRVPGREAIHAKGWLPAHRWLILRRASQTIFLAIFLVGPITGFWLVEGTLASSRTLDFLPLTDPFILLQSLAAGRLPELTALVGAAIVLAAYMLVGGRSYCAWVCPINPVSDLAHWLNTRLGLSKGWQPKPESRLWLMALAFIGSALTGAIFWELVNPVTLAHRALVFGLAAGWFAVLAVFIFEFLVSRRGWCGRLCPVGAFYGQINRVSLLRVAAVNREACDDCMDCFAVCPEPQVLPPALKGSGSRRIDGWACTHCARCADVCAQNVFAFSLPSRGKE